MELFLLLTLAAVGSAAVIMDDNPDPGPDEPVELDDPVELTGAIITDDTLNGGTGDDTLTGNRFDNDLLLGGTGDDLLNLEVGNTGTGGEGADLLVADYQYQYGPEDGPIVVTDFTPGEDRLELIDPPSWLEVVTLPEGAGVGLATQDGDIFLEMPGLDTFPHDSVFVDVGLRDGPDELIAFASDYVRYSVRLSEDSSDQLTMVKSSAEYQQYYETRDYSREYTSISDSADRSSAVLHSTPEATVLNGGNGAQELRGGTGMEMLNGGEGNDKLASSYYGSSGNHSDYISNHMDSHAEVLDGGAGNDSLTGAAGDTFIGGTGTDRFTVYTYAGDVEDAPVIRDFEPSNEIVTVHLGGGAVMREGFGFEDPSYNLDGRISTHETSVGDSWIMVDGQVALVVEGQTGLTLGYYNVVVGDQRTELLGMEGAPLDEAEADITLNVYFSYSG